MENLITELKVKIIEILNLEDVTVEDIKDNDTLFSTVCHVYNCRNL